MDLAKLKGKVPPPAPSEAEDMELELAEDEAASEEKAGPLASISDEELIAELRKRGLVEE